MTQGATPGRGTPPPRGPGRRRSIARGSALVAAGMLLAAALGGVAILADLRFGGGRIVRAAMGGGDLADACRPPLVRRLAERGFQPDDVEFGPDPTLGPPWGRERSFGDSFTFRDGAAGTRVDGVVACVVSGSGVTVDFRVAQNPRRAA